MNEREVQLTRVEAILVVGFVGCLLLATWELVHLATDVWLHDWVRQDRFARERIIRYGIGLSISVATLLLTTRSTTSFGRFGRTATRALLWYATLLLLTTVAWFIFDCLPEVVVGILGAGLFLATIYAVQRRFFTRERVMRSRMEKNQCPHCGAAIQLHPRFCGTCGLQIGWRCPACNEWTHILDRFCSHCGYLVAAHDAPSPGPHATHAPKTGSV